MSLGVVGLVMNNLKNSKILEVAENLNKIQFLNNKKWNWQNKIDEAFLNDYWERNQKWYIDNLESKETFEDAII